MHGSAMHSIRWAPQDGCPFLLERLATARLPFSVFSPSPYLVPPSVRAATQPRAGTLMNALWGVFSLYLLACAPSGVCVCVCVCVCVTLSGGSQK